MFPFSHHRPSSFICFFSSHVLVHHHYHSNSSVFSSLLFFGLTDIEGKVPEHRITGQYRNQSSRIWDPHPQYLIDAFGLHLHLILYQEGNFIPKSMKVMGSVKRSCFDFRRHSFGWQGESVSFFWGLGAIIVWEWKNGETRACATDGGVNFASLEHLHKHE